MVTKIKNINKQRAVKKFYKISVSAEKISSIFNDEYNILLKTIDSVNSFNTLYKTGRKGAKGGPPTHQQQDLYRAMLIFACAGLDVFVKQLVQNKLPQLLQIDRNAQVKFKEYVKRGIKKDEKEILNTIALALIDSSPRDIFLKEYISDMTGESLQSVGELCRISDASGLDTKKIFNDKKNNAVKDAFRVRNQIIHEMDINIRGDISRTRGQKARRQRIGNVMEKHTITILKLAEELFIAYKEMFQKYKIGIEKSKGVVKSQ